MESAEHGAPPTTDHGDFRIPSSIPGRLEAVPDAIDAAFAEGWRDPGGIDIARRDLSAAAMFLAGSAPSSCRRRRKHWDGSG
jgi:hypothetical protein